VVGWAWKNGSPGASFWFLSVIEGELKLREKPHARKNRPGTTNEAGPGLF
jgi:hypothetical protein